MSDKEKSLQDLASGLSFTKGRFTADDVRQRLGGSSRPRRRWGIAAAAVLALVLSHAGAYLIGGGSRDRSEASPVLGPIAETKRILTRASRIDENLPYDVLREELGGLRRAIRMAGLPARLRNMDDARAPRLADAVSQLELALESLKDPGFSVMVVTSIARASLEGSGPVRLLPAGTSSYAHVRPLPGNRFRVYVIDAARGVMVNDEGTLPELRRLHPEIQFVTGE